MDNDSTVLKPRRGSVWLGLVLGVLLTVLYFELRRYVSVDPIHWVILLGAFQWIYILPLVFILRRHRRHPRTAMGLLIVGLLVMAAIVALFMLNLFPHAF